MSLLVTLDEFVAFVARQRGQPIVTAGGHTLFTAEVTEAGVQFIPGSGKARPLVRADIEAYLEQFNRTGSTITSDYAGDFRNASYVLGIVKALTTQPPIVKPSPVLHFCVKRVSPNSAGWRKPTPDRLSSPMFSGYPKDCGFGHEDWNFDESLAIKGSVFAHLKYEPAKTKRRDRFNFALVHIEAGKHYVVGFLLGARFVENGAPSDRRVAKRKGEDLWQLQRLSSLGGKWAGQSKQRLVALIESERWCLQWQVPVDGLMPLPKPVLIPADLDFAPLHRLKSFSATPEIGADLFRKALSVCGDVADPETEATGKEGKIVEQWHRTRERNYRVVRAAKEQFVQKHGRLFCEVCEFDFGASYGEPDFIEAHHRIPLRDLPENVETKAADFAMVCANCHRMLHRGSPWPSLEQLRERMRRRVAGS